MSKDPPFTKHAELAEGEREKTLAMLDQPASPLPEEPPDGGMNPEARRILNENLWELYDAAEEPPELKEALNRFRMWARNVILREGIPVEYGLALDDEATARADLLALYDRQREEIERLRSRE